MDDEQTSATSSAAPAEAHDPTDMNPPARVFAPLPSLKPDRPPLRRRALTTLAVVGVIVALLASGVAALALTGRLRGAVVLPSGGGALNATQVAQREASILPPQYAITAISMDSPTDGWAIMVNQAGDHGSAFVLHITNGAVTQQASLTAVAGSQATLQALSPTDVWVLFGQMGGSFYHYDGHTWAQVSLPAPADAIGNSVSDEMFHMVSPSEGWAIASYMLSSPQGATPNSKQVFYHYDGSAWRMEPAEKAATAGSVAGSSSNQTFDIQITGMSATPSGDVWVTGYVQTQTQDANGNLTNSTTTGYLYHRVGGVWRLAQTLPNDELYGIAMTGPGSGWIIGMNDQTKREGGNIAPYTVVIQTPIALSWNGARWSPAPIPQPEQAQSGLRLSQVAASSPSNVWIAGLPGGANQTLDAGSPYASDATYLVHYDGVRWTRVALPEIAAINQDAGAVNSVSFAEISLTPTGDVWMSGALAVFQTPNYHLFPLLYHYSGGQWDNIALPTIKSSSGSSSSGSSSSAGQPAG